jgi:hypothetical protein
MAKWTWDTFKYGDYHTADIETADIYANFFNF